MADYREPVRGAHAIRGFAILVRDLHGRSQV